ncbi:hypothetical protein CIB84_015339 [Bambusicola thoracicus]|uniref:Uncharacterized protein n=1 Tax=Bambusicola thoracicus TaxID=9083 RepID=A0A2P4S9W4_BAMTH|nr:hypothetical protein CIB84_015339 [Bambusicola thoracicus]
MARTFLLATVSAGQIFIFSKPF